MVILQGKKGFTLIELMIVVAIVGILAAIAIPNFLRFQAKSRQAEAKANLGAIYTALEAFRGEIKQAPPAFSAIKRGGRKAYELARRGEVVELEARPVTIYSLRLDEWQPPDAVLDVYCSAGTYIRSLAHDLGQALGCGAHLTALRRIAAGHFAAEQAVGLDDLQAAFAAGTWKGYLRPPQAALPLWPVVQLQGEAIGRLAHGNAVPDNDWPAKGSEPTTGGNASGGMALAVGPDGSLLAVVEHDEAAGVWQPRKVFIGRK